MCQLQSKHLLWNRHIIYPISHLLFLRMKKETCSNIFLNETVGKYYNINFKYTISEEIQSLKHFFKF